MSNQESIKAAVIIPVYNEEKGVRDSFSDLLKVAEEYNIIVVNDGSTDSTSDVLKEFKGIMVIDHKNNLGYGASLKTGIKNQK